MPLQATSGAASYDAFGGGVPVAANYIEDVFSTWLYTGNGSTQAINNGIDLAGKGGFAWIKRRSNTQNHNLFDTLRGPTQRLFSNLTNAQDPDVASLTAFNSNGFTLGADSGVNGLGETYASWTFREQPKFFDVVTYTGNGSTQNISHNLGSVPGCIIVKRISQASNTGWPVYHRSANFGTRLFLNLTNNATGAQEEEWFGNNLVSVAPTSTQFTVGSNQDINANSNTYVAYLFAHNAGGFGLSGTDNVISCGSYTGTGSAGNTQTLGYEPQWIMVKKSSSATVGDWFMVDTMRGFSMGNDNILYANQSVAQDSGAEIDPTATGFQFPAGSNLNASGATYIYVAVRRGPMRTPTTGTSVFTPVARSGTGATSTVSNGITTDLIISMVRNTGEASGVWDRLRGFPAYLATTSTAAESTSANSVTAMNNTAYVLGADGGTDRINRSGYTYANWTFSRAPGFFDEVCYSNAASISTPIPHNLGVVPQLVIYKRRDSTGAWFTAQNVSGYSYGTLNTTDAFIDLTTLPAYTSTNIYPLISTGNIVAYLFATCAGVSKVGSYTGTGTTQTINCGFTAGSRFVLIKRTDSTGDWYVWDSARGIVAGNDPYLLLNSTAAEVTSTDFVDTAATGFELSSTAPAAINASGGTFIFLAIA